MTNLEIAWIFSEIAELLELKDENPFKIRAYRKGAEVLQQLPEGVEKVHAEGRLAGLPGIGKNLIQKIAEILNTGSCVYLDKLREEIPPGLREMMAIPGLGPKSIRLIYQQLGVRTLDELENAARAKKVRSLPGLGNKTELNILRGIELLRKSSRFMLLGIALEFAEELIGHLRSLPGVTEVAIAGSARRGKEVVGNIDLVVAAGEPGTVANAVTHYPRVKEVLAVGEQQISLLTDVGLRVDINLVDKESFISALHFFTGSREHNVRLQGRALARSLIINSQGLFRLPGEQHLPIDSEEDIYRAVDLPLIPPELREDIGEIEIAAAGRLPSLVKPGDIKGDLHLHTHWSDGINTVEEMAAAARSRGYAYIAVTDHSRSLAIANGLSLERLQKQFGYLRKLNSEMDDLQLLAGIEVDIKMDGSLDFDDEVLAGADLVIASVHSGFHQEKEKLTERVLGACKNPHVDIIAHPTGRILGRREPYAIDLEKVLDTASKTGTMLEINASPDRLDLSDVHARQAKELAIGIVINTDAHDCLHLADMRYGVMTARRGWLEPKDVVNTWDLPDLLRRLEKKPGV
ncbi:MAG: DNA polymerase/3'-5' exonuclease PolX [Bacillota bacterium]